MPKVSTDIPNHQDYITRPIARAIAEEVIRYSGLDVNEIIFLGSAESVMNAGSSIDNREAVSSFSEANKARLTIEEEFRPESLMTSGILADHGRTIFHDTESNVYLIPIRTDATMTLEMTYSASTAAEARNWMNRMQQALERRLEISTHAIAYSYPIPHEYISSLTKVHGLRESGSFVYGQDLGTYLRSKFSGKVKVRSKLNGTGQQFVVEETQHDILGTLDFDEIPKPSKEGQVFTVAFSYTVRYERPFAMVMDYPIVINNNLIPDDLRPKRNRIEELKFDSSTIRNWFDGVVNVDRDTTARVGGYSIPDFDDWTVPYPPKETGSIFRLLITVDPNDTSLILDLNDLGQYSLNEDVISLMQQFGQMIFEYAHCPILVMLYEDNKPIDPLLLSLEGTTLRINGRPLDGHRSYHLRIAMLTNLAMMSEPASALMLSNPNATRSLLLALEPDLVAKGLMPKIRHGKLDVIEYRKAVDFIRTTSVNYSALGEVDRVRVAYLTISARREET